jgi:Fe-S cluster assembly protein SufD
LDDEAIYYLRTRGVPKSVAQRMLVHAFAGEIIDRIGHDELREELDELVWQHLEDFTHFQSESND